MGIQENLPVSNSKPPQLSEGRTSAILKIWKETPPGLLPNVNAVPKIGDILELNALYDAIRARIDDALTDVPEYNTDTMKAAVASCAQIVAGYAKYVDSDLNLDIFLAVMKRMIVRGDTTFLRTAAHMARVGQSAIDADLAHAHAHIEGGTRENMHKRYTTAMAAMTHDVAKMVSEHFLQGENEGMVDTILTSAQAHNPDRADIHALLDTANAKSTPDVKRRRIAVGLVYDTHADFGPQHGEIYERFIMKHASQASARLLHRLGMSKDICLVAQMHHLPPARLRKELDDMVTQGALTKDESKYIYRLVSQVKLTDAYDAACNRIDHGAGKKPLHSAEFCGELLGLREIQFADTAVDHALPWVRDIYAESNKIRIPLAARNMEHIAQRDIAAYITRIAHDAQFVLGMRDIYDDPISMDLSAVIEEVQEIVTAQCKKLDTIRTELEEPQKRTAWQLLRQQNANAEYILECIRTKNGLQMHIIPPRSQGMRAHNMTATAAVRLDTTPSHRMTA